MKAHYLAFISILLAACATSTPPGEPTPEPGVRPDIGILWVENAAEYQAISALVYAEARRDLERFVADPGWSALPGVTDVAGKPPAIILDVDETVVSNAVFQETLVHSPYTRFRHFDFMRNNAAVPVRGAAETIAAARAAGVAVYFLTNRACEAIDGVEGTCPYEQVTIDDLREAGIETDAEHVLMAWEQPDWNKEKLNRRLHVAKTHRVIMLFGDDYGDFVACARAIPLPPCTEAATRAHRHATVEEYADLWGNGWYILPNPMHGSWTRIH